MGSTFMRYNAVVVYIDWGSRGIMGDPGAGDGEDIYAGDGMEGICYGYATDAPERERGIMCA